MQIRALRAKGQGDVRGLRRTLAAQGLYQARRIGQRRCGPAQYLQILVAGFEPIGLRHQGLDACHVGRQILRHLGPHIDVHADDPTQRPRRLQERKHLLVFRRYQEQRADIQNAWPVGRSVRAQQLRHRIHGVVAVSHAFAVKAVAGVAVFNLHHGQRGGRAAIGRVQSHIVGPQLRGQRAAKPVGGQGVEVAHGCPAQTGGARHVVRAATGKRDKAAIGLHHAVHQRFAQDPEVFGIHSHLTKAGNKVAGCSACRNGLQGGYVRCAAQPPQALTIVLQA